MGDTEIIYTNYGDAPATALSLSSFVFLPWNAIIASAVVPITNDVPEDGS